MEKGENLSRLATNPFPRKKADLRGILEIYTLTPLSFIDLRTIAKKISGRLSPSPEKEHSELAPSLIISNLRPTPLRGKKHASAEGGPICPNITAGVGNINQDSPLGPTFYNFTI